MSPTFTTKVPSPAPSVTGIVVTLTLSSTTNILNATEVAVLEAELAAEYGVDSNDVTVEASYTVSGSIDVENIPDDVTDVQLEEILEQSIADALGVHSKDVDVTVDPTTGEVTYTVTSSDDVAATDIQNALESDTFLNDLNNEIVEDIPTATVATVSADEEIEMELVVVIDATESTVDIEETNRQITAEFENQGVSADSESTMSSSIKKIFRLCNIIKSL